MAWYSWSQTAASNASADSSINWAEGQAPSSVNDSARAMMAATAKYRDDVNGSLTTGGTSTAYTLTTNSAYDTLAHLDGQVITITMHATSGASPTLSVDSLTAKPLRVATGVAPSTGAFLSGSPYKFKYGNSVGEFLLLNQPAVLAPSSVSTSSIASSAVTYAKLQNETASTILGNPTGSSAAPSEITLGAGLSFSGTTLTATPAGAQNYISGLTMSTAGSSGTMAIAAGVANDSTNSTFMTLASSISKTTASWAVGTGNGGLDTGAIANTTWYHFYEIERVDTGVVDVVFSTSASAPTLPTNYTIYRRIGSGKTDGSAHWVSFVQNGDTFILPAPVNDVTNAAVTAATSVTLASVPTGVKVQALTRGTIAGASVGFHFLLFGGDETAVLANATTGNVTATTLGSSVVQGFSPPPLWTNTSAQLQASAGSGASISLRLATYGWIDSRGKG